MRVLVVDSFARDEPGKHLVDHAVQLLIARGHGLDRIDLLGTDFPRFMTEEERRRYHDVGDNVCCPHVAASVESIRAADAVLFGYPTTMFTIPAHLKGWLERTMLPGVGFVLNERHQVRPGLPSVRRIGAITTTPHSRTRMRAVGDNGRHTLMRSFRANCASRCRRSFLSVADVDIADGVRRVERTFRAW